MTTPRIWMNGELVPLSDATCSPLSHALHYGTGVFEGIRSYQTPEGPAIFRLQEHLERMRKGADVLGIPFDVEAVGKGCLEVLQANQLGDAYLRPLSFYALGGLTLDLRVLQASHMVAAMGWKPHLADAVDEGVTMHTSSYRRNPHQAMPALKLCGGYVNACIAKREALAHGCEEALFLDDQGHVVEATGENVFLVKNGRVVAAEHPDALPGITRATIIELTSAEVRPVHHSELMDADEIFLTGTSAEVTPVGRLDKRVMKPGPVSLELRALYLDLVHGQVEGHKNWLSYADAVAPGR